jgi:hypothetical protein
MAIENAAKQEIIPLGGVGYNSKLEFSQIPVKNA